MQVRLLNNTDLIQAQHLWDYSFEKKDTPFFQWYFNEYVTAHNIIGYFAKSMIQKTSLRRLIIELLN